MNATLKQNAQTAIDTAALHVNKGPMASSAQLRLADARVCFDHGCYREAIGAAKDSVDYSLGVFSPEHDVLAAMLAA